MPLKLPARPDLDRLRRQAKELLHAARAGADEPLQRLVRFFPTVTPLTAQLSHAQTVIARDYGYPSWRALAAAVARRVARLDERTKRDDMHQLEVAALAETWFVLAERNDLVGLWHALAVPKRKLEPARAVMQSDRARYDRYLDVLVAALADPNPRLRFEFAHALDTFGDARSIEPLRRLMNDPVPRVRWMAMHALTCHACGEATCTDDPELIEEIVAHARGDASIKVRQHATIALGLSGYRPIEPVLREILATAEDRRIQNAAKFSLGELAR
jgi:HEAT repeat protein